MNELRIFIVALLAVVVGFAGAWMVFGSRAAKLASENQVLREQKGQLIQQLDRDNFDPRLLVGRWATTVEKSDRGKVELIVELRDGGIATWQSSTPAGIEPIAEGKWKFRAPSDIDFDLLIVSPRSPDKGQRRTTLATIRDATSSLLVLDVEGTEWVFVGAK